MKCKIFEIGPGVMLSELENMINSFLRTEIVKEIISHTQTYHPGGGSVSVTIFYR